MGAVFAKTPKGQDEINTKAGGLTFSASSLIAKALHPADLIERRHRLFEQLLCQLGVMDLHDARHQLLLGEVDEVEDTAP